MVLELVNQSIAAMTSCFDSFSCKPRSNNATSHVNRARVSSDDSNFITCPRAYKSAVADILILIAVIGSSGYLLYPCLRSIFIGLVETISSISDLVKEEFCDAPLIYASIGLSVFCSGLATWALVACTSNKCGNPSCKGLRKAAEFDIQLETEELVKNSSENNNGSFNNKCVLELPMNHHRELQAELKKMAPPNGRAVLVFRARCGCSAGRLEVPGPKKSRKIKK